MDTTRVVVPDGGWGWVVVAAVAFINMTNQSILSVFGLLFGSQLKSMHQETFTAALITNLNSLALNFSGLFIGPAIKSFKPRNVALFGCLMVSFGMLICSFATQISHFILGYSFFVGIGLGLISPSTFMAINSYFTNKRGRAVGVSLAGAGLGQVFIPHLVRWFLDNYGFRAAALSMSAMSSAGILGALLLKPLTPLTTHNKHNNRQHIKLLLELETKQGGGGTTHNQLEIRVFKECNEKAVYNETTLTATTNESKGQKLCNKLCHRLVQAMDLELLKDAIFWSIIIGMALVYTSTINFTMLFPHFLQYSVGLSITHTATCMSAVAGADIVSRLLIPCVTDKLKIPYRVVFLLGAVGLLISRAALAESADMTSIIVMSIFTGMTKSATVLNNNLTIMEHCRHDKLAGGLGLSMIAKGMIVITFGQLLGWIRDYSQSYVMGLHAQNFVLLLVILFWTPEMCYRYYKQRKQKNLISTGEQCESATAEELAKINENKC